MVYSIFYYKIEWFYIELKFVSIVFYFTLENRMINKKTVYFIFE